MAVAAGPGQCVKCGRRSLLAQHFRRRRCPACQPREYGWGESLALIFYGCAVGGAVLWLATPSHSWLLLPLLCVFSLLLSVLHEAVHAGVARLLGWRVPFMKLGAGAPWKIVQVGRMPLVLRRRLWNGGGLCAIAPPAGRFSRGAAACIIGAPMAAHLLVAGLVWRWAPAVPSARLLAGLNVLFFASSAWPRRLREDPELASDGKLLLDLSRRPAEEEARWRRAAWTNPVIAMLMRDRGAEAFQLAERASVAHPDDARVAWILAAAAGGVGRWDIVLSRASTVAAQEEENRSRALQALPENSLAARGLLRGADLEAYVRGSALVGVDRLPEALALSEQRLAAAESEEVRALWQGCVALALLLAGGDLDRAEDAARCAYERLPWVPLVETTWGMTQIERGDRLAGLRAFGRVARADRAGRMTGLRLAWTAVARVAAGDRVRAQEILESLRAPSMWPACRRRVERALGG